MNSFSKRARKTLALSAFVLVMGATQTASAKICAIATSFGGDKDAYLNAAEKHCDRGDIIRVPQHYADYVCNFDKAIVMTQDDMTQIMACEYQGTRDVFYPD